MALPRHQRNGIDIVVESNSRHIGASNAEKRSIAAAVMIDKAENISATGMLTIEYRGRRILSATKRRRQFKIIGSENKCAA